MLSLFYALISSSNGLSSGYGFLLPSHSASYSWSHRSLLTSYCLKSPLSLSLLATNSGSNSIFYFAFTSQIWSYLDVLSTSTLTTADRLAFLFYLSNLSLDLKDLVIKAISSSGTGTKGSNPSKTSWMSRIKSAFLKSIFTSIPAIIITFLSSTAY